MPFVPALVIVGMLIVPLAFPVSALFLPVVSLALIALAPFSNRTVMLLLAERFFPLRLAIFSLALLIG